VRYTFIRPFVDAAQTVLEQALSAEVVPEEPTLASKSVVSRGVASIVGVTGEAHGSVLFDMSLTIAKKVAGQMNGETMSELGDLGKDTLSELASMITGRAITILNDAGHELKVSPPTLLTGDNMTISGLELETLVVPLRTALGEIVVNVAITTG
jgi:chemotaxis protein CheX